MDRDDCGLVVATKPGFAHTSSHEGRCSSDDGFEEADLADVQPDDLIVLG